jgi:hypothetical protein
MSDFGFSTDGSDSYGFSVPQGLDSISSVPGATGAGSTSVSTLLGGIGNLGSLLSASGTGSLGNLTSSVGDGNTITQSERLFTTRDRYSFVNPNGGGDRGTRAYIRLMTNSASGTTTNVTANASSSVAGFTVPSGLTGTGSPLDQAINGGTYGGYAEFLLTDIQCSLDEKLQITETFGDGEVIYYFGRSPIIFSLSGILVDSQDNSWFIDWINMYGHVMRGTQLAQNYSLLKLVLPNMTLVGSIPHMSYHQNSANDVQIQFEFQFIVKEMTPNPVLSSGSALSSAANLINFGTANSFLSQQGINSILSQSNALQSTIADPSSTVSDIASGMAGLGSGLNGSVASYMQGLDDSTSSATPGIGSTASGTVGGIGSAIGNAVNSGISSLVNGSNSLSAGINDVFYSIDSNLAGIRASLFSPIYGVLTSLTKLISNVAGDVATVFAALAAPVANIIRDVASVASQALGILNIISAAGNTILGIGNLSQADLQISIGQLSNTMGCVTTQPIPAVMTLQAMLNSGTLPATTGYLINPPIAALAYNTSNLPTKIAMLNSGPTPTATTGASL